MHRNQRNQRGSGGGGGFHNKKGLLGEPPGLGRNNAPLSGGLGLLGSAPGQGMPGGVLGGPMGAGMNQSLFGGSGMGAGLLDQSRNQAVNQGGNQGMNQNMMAGMQHQMAAAAMRDSQLQLVSNLIQQQGGMSSSMVGGQGPGGMMQSGQGMGGGLLGMGGRGGMGMIDIGHGGGGRSGVGNIPSLFDINTKQSGLLGKRGNTSLNRESRFSNNQNSKRMRQNSQEQSPRGSQQNRQGQQHRQSRWSDRSPNRAGGRSRDRDFRRPSSRDSSKYSDRSPSSRTSRDRRESESSSTSETKKEESEEYDPAQPTEEDDDELEVPPLDGDDVAMTEEAIIPEVTVQVKPDQEEAKEEGEELAEETQSPSLAKGGDSSLTITLSQSGRSVNDVQSSQASTHSQQEVTTPPKKSANYCHACGVDCRTEEGFFKHMNGKKHKVRMESLLTLHQEKSKQLEARIKAEEHLRKIEGKPRQERRNSGNEGRFSQYSGRYQREPFGSSTPTGRFRNPGPAHMTSFGHRHGNQGGAKQKSCDHELWPRCNVCCQMFKSPQKFIRHLKTPHHQQNLRDRGRKSSRDEDEEEGFPDFGDMVTVDTIGFEDDYMDKSDSEEDDNTDNSGKAPVTSVETTDKSGVILTDQEHDPNTPVGQKYIVPVSGFFCKLCHRFYNSESAAKIGHCKSKSHFEKVQKVASAKALNKEIQKDLKSNSQQNCKKDSQSDSQCEVNNQSGNQQEVMDQSEGHKEVHVYVESEVSKRNGGLNSEIIENQNNQSEKSEVRYTSQTCDIDPALEEKLLGSPKDEGSHNVEGEQQSLEVEEEMDAEQEDELKTECVTTPKVSGRGRGGVRGRGRRARRGRN